MDRRSEANRYVLALRIGWHPKSGAEARLPYDVDVEGEAFYRLDEPYDPAGKEMGRLLLLNGSAILFGSLRAQVAQVTALGVNGMVLLPPVNQIDALKRRLQAKPRRTKNQASGATAPPEPYSG